MNFEFDQKDERLVRTVVRVLLRKYQITGIDEDDLFQEGVLGYIKAKMTYQEQGKAKFETYASIVIRNHVLDYIRKQIRDYPDDITNDVPIPNSVNEVDSDPILWEILNKVLEENCDLLERSIFNAYYKGYSYQEIGEIFEINKKKVDNTIQKVYRLAKSFLAD
ncbi:MAG: sigma-70 family RNA polymerase sigma factor [Clostridia bacterium]|nr:sigma-70 family RNA polymerase sigma factor [Clostridia bacterium]